MAEPVDPIVVSVIQHRLLAIVEEMGEAMLRTSYSQILNSSRDFSTAICDLDGRLIAQAEHVPIHVGALPFAAKAMTEFFGDDIHQGDVFLLNDPYHGGNHLPDLTAFVPVFEGAKGDGRPRFWSINRAHQSDIGGATHGAYNAAATDIWQEGIRITPLRLYDRGEVRRDLLEMIATNVRHPRDFRGDLAAMIGSAHVGERRLLALATEFGWPLANAAIEAVLDGAERQTRAVIAEWRDGVYHGEALLDDDGRGNSDIHIRATVTKRGSDLTVDLSDSHEQVTSFINSSYPNMYSSVVVALSYLIDPGTPKNDGTFRPLKVVAKPGTVVWANPGAPVTLATNHCGQEIIEAIIKALAPACPDRAMAGWGRRFRIAIQGNDPRSGKPFIWHFFQARPGGGASPAGDGWPGAGEWQAAGGIKFGSLEVTEVRFPLFFRRHEFRPDSGGAGKYRGGPGGIVEMVVETAEPAVGNTAGDGVRYGACGILGGTDGAPHRYMLYSKGEEPRAIKTKEVGLLIRPNDVLVLESGGGGGWGDTAERDPAAFASDLENGFVAEAAPHPPIADAMCPSLSPPGRGEGLHQQAPSPRLRSQCGERVGVRGKPVYRIGIDVGGTFTDLVAVDEFGRTTLAKVSSTPGDPSIGVLDGLKLLADMLEIELAALLSQTERLVHGTTVATNALLQRKGARVGLLTTAGHRDVIEMREGLKDDRYNLRLPPPEQLVLRKLRVEIRERLRADGRIETPLDPASLDRAIVHLREENVEAVAVCYLHAYRDPKHERATREAIARDLPGAYVSLSSEVLPQIKEYERVSTTIVNAYVGPAVSRYLARLEGRLAEAGYRGPTLIIQSHGGVAPIDESVRLAAGAVLSGPAGGVAGSVYAARLLDVPNLIPFDMGGTSTDISLIVGGQPSLATGRRVAGHAIALNSLDITSIGAGGGSIARVDAGGILHVGPESAGAVPGPACYGSGGLQATVTDANLVLGYLDPAGFLGGRRLLDRAAAETAVDNVAASLGIDRLAAARGIHRVVNTTMAEGVRLVSVRRGVDPRRFALLAFGGASGLHVTEIARQLDLSRVVVPRVAPVLSAWGMLATDLRFEVSRTHIGDTRALDGEAVKRLFGEMEAEGLARLRASPRSGAGAGFDGPSRTMRSVDMRYGEQVFEIAVPLDEVDWAAADPLPQIVERFHRRHEELYTYCMPDQETVLVNARVAVAGILSALPQEPHLPEGPPTPPRSERRIYLDDWVATPVYDFDALAPAQTISGPAIVESAMTTVLLRPGERAQVTPLGWLDIAISYPR